MGTRFFERSCFWCVHRFACGLLKTTAWRVRSTRQQVKAVVYLVPFGDLSRDWKAWRGMELCAMTQRATGCKQYQVDNRANAERQTYIDEASRDDPPPWWLGGGSPGPPWTDWKFMSWAADECGQEAKPACASLIEGAASPEGRAG